MTRTHVRLPGVPLTPPAQEGATPAVDKINPDHYRAGGMQAVDVIETFFQDDAHLSQAFKYMSRAGKKEGSSYQEDLLKARWWLDRAISRTTDCATTE